MTTTSEAASSAGANDSSLTSSSQEPSPLPARRMVVLACMDCRLDPYQLLDLGVGDAHIVRNGGGVLTDDALRSIVMSQRVLGTDHVVVLQHTRCGMHDFDDRAFRETLQRDTGVVAPWDEAGFHDVRENLRWTVEALRNHPLLQSRSVRGLLYDTKEKRLEAVD